MTDSDGRPVWFVKLRADFRDERGRPDPRGFWQKATSKPVLLLGSEEGNLFLLRTGSLSAFGFSLVFEDAGGQSNGFRSRIEQVMKKAKPPAKREEGAQVPESFDAQGLPEGGRCTQIHCSRAVGR